jgi:hypothetical protein
MTADQWQEVYRRVTAFTETEKEARVHEHYSLSD